jgi:hypothetical protein
VEEALDGEETVSKARALQPFLITKEAFLEKIGALLHRMATRKRRTQDGGRTDPAGRR